MKKFTKFIGIFSLVIGMSITTMGATLTDVPKTHWAYVAINDVADRGIMITNSAGEFNANKEMTFFELADALAKATGYVDVDQVSGIEEKFKVQVKNNYEKQKPILETYTKKYSTWNSAYNQQIAYLLGRGYIKVADLDKFITKTAQGETKNIVTKEQLSVYIVRILGREKTATTTYKTTTFKDDAKLQVENKPYVAYLNHIGFLNPDAYGNVNGTSKVTKAVCAKLISDSLKINDTSKVGRIQTTTDTTTSAAIKPTTSTNSNGNVVNAGVVTEVKEKVQGTIEAITIKIGDITKTYNLTEDTKLIINEADQTTKKEVLIGENIIFTVSNDQIVSIEANDMPATQI